MTATAEFALATRLAVLAWCVLFPWTGTPLFGIPQEPAGSTAKTAHRNSPAGSGRTWIQPEPLQSAFLAGDRPVDPVFHLGDSGETVPGSPDSGTSQGRVGYGRGFIIEGDELENLDAPSFPYRLKINGWGQLRHTILDSDGANPDVNQFQLARARLVLSGHALTPDFSYYLQLDGRSSSGDNFRLLDYYLGFDIGHARWGCEPGTVVLKTGKYKMPFSLARHLSGQEMQFSDRSVASTFFDVNRSLAWGAFGKLHGMPKPLNWEAAIFNGLVTGGAETGSSGELDNNFAYSFRLSCSPSGDWGYGEQSDFEWHCDPATRIGCGAAFSTIDQSGGTEFQAMRVVDSGLQLAQVLPAAVEQYSVALYSLDASVKYRGCSLTAEYYFRSIHGFVGFPQPSLFDHGYWLEAGCFLVPEKFELIARWSRVAGDSGTLGLNSQSSDERAGGIVWYWRRQSAKLTMDATYLDGAPVDSAALGIHPGDRGWLARTQIQFSF